MTGKRNQAEVQPSPAEVIREYGPFRETDQVGGVTFDGKEVWYAASGRVHSFDPDSGDAGRSLDVTARAGTAFDGRYLFQIEGGVIRKVEPHTGRVVATIPAPGNGTDSGLTWAEGKLWVGEYRSRKIHQIDPDTGRVLRTLESTRCVTGVTFADGELWHGTWEGDESELRRIDHESGEVLERLAMPAGLIVSGLEYDGRDRFYCGGGDSGKIRAVRKPPRRARGG